MSVNRMRISDADMRIIVLVQIDTREVETPHVCLKLHPEDAVTLHSNLQLFSE